MVYPIEVKSGHNAHLRSLHSFMNHSNQTVAVRIWSQPYAVDEVKTADGKGLKPSSFVADAILTCVADTQAKELHFSSLGSGGGGTVVSKTPPEDTDVNWFNPDNRLLSVNVSGEWIAIAGVYGK